MATPLATRTTTHTTSITPPFEQKVLRLARLFVARQATYTQFAEAVLAYEQALALQQGSTDLAAVRVEGRA